MYAVQLYVYNTVFIKYNNWTVVGVTWNNMESDRGRHHWTRTENEELMFCYYTSHPNVRGFRKRLYDLWHERNTDSIYSSFSEQKLCGQVWSLQKREYFTSVELNWLELCALGDDVHDGESDPSTHHAGVSSHGDDSLLVYSSLSMLGTPEVYQIVLSEYQSTLFTKVMEALENQMESLPATIIWSKLSQDD